MASSMSISQRAMHDDPHFTGNHLGRGRSILLNPHDQREAPVLASTGASRSHSQGGLASLAGGLAKPRPPPVNVNPSSSAGQSDRPTAARGSSGSSGGDAAALGVPPSGSTSPRIRFAPLPDTALLHPRSSSTGFEDGAFEVRAVNDGGNYDDAIASDDDDDYDWEADHNRRKSWATATTHAAASSWKVSKKMMGLRSHKKDNEYEYGAPLKKSSSTGQSAMRSSAEVERRKTLTGTSPSAGFLSSMGMGAMTGGRRGSTASNSSNGNGSNHRRGGSMGNDAPLPAVRMLNGRVYGARRASEAASLEKLRRERLEPTFVEWSGMQKANQETSTSTPATKDKFEYDDGGGMAWVRKRREERERREREAAQRAAESDHAESEGDEARGRAEDEPQLDRPASLASSHSSVASPATNQTPLTPRDHEPQFSNPFAAIATPAIQITAHEGKPQIAHDSMDGDANGDEEDAEEEDDNGDFSSDDEDDLAEDEATSNMTNMTSAAAGVEVYHRHKGSRSKRRASLNA